MPDVIQKLYESVVNADSDLAKEVATEALKQRIDPLRAIEDGLVKGIREVGTKFGNCEIFLTDLVMAAEAFKAGVQVLEPELAKKKTQVRTIGTVVLGTVAGDIHSIGKDIVGVLLTAAGFKVHDLGVDVPVDTFIERAQALNADIVGASALLSTTVPEQWKIAQALKDAGIKNKVKFMIGGQAISENWAKEIGADAWALSAPEGVEKAKKLMGI